MKQYHPIYAGIALALLAANAQAAIEGFEFTSEQGEARILDASAININPGESLKIVASAGLDRKLRVSLLSGNVAVESTSTGVITIADRLTFNNKEFYGKKITLPTPAEGSYTLKIEMLDTQGSVLTQWQQDVIIDTTPPTVGSFSWSMPYSGLTAPDGLPIWSRVEARHITLNGVTEENGGFSGSYKFVFVDGDRAGEIDKQGDLTAYPADQKLMLGNGNNNSFVPPTGSQAKMELRFFVTDTAGNTTTAIQPFYQQGTCGPAPEFVAYEDPDYTAAYLDQQVFSGFRPYEGTAVQVKLNPLRSVYRWPKSRYRGTPEGAIYGGYPAYNGAVQQNLVVHEDSEYVYFIINGTVEPAGRYSYTTRGWTNRHTWMCGSLAVPNPQFSEGTEPPVTNGIEAYIDNYGWVGNNFADWGGDLPDNTQVSTIRYKAQTRTYDQQISAGSLGSCTIPTGESYCDAAVSISINAIGSAGHLHSRPYLKDSATGTMYDDYSFVYEWDNAAPTVDELISHDPASKVVVFKATELYTGSTWGRKKMKNASLIAVNTNTNEEVSIPATMQADGNTVYATASYQSLPDGNYRLDGYVHDNYHLDDRRELFSLQIDASAPVINIKADDESSFNDVVGLESIIIELADLHKAEINSVRLQGGPASDDVYLAVRETADNTYALEYPRIFPSMEAEETYTLTVDATDEFGNHAQNNVTFTYQPDNIIVLDHQITLPVNQMLYDKSNTPMSIIKSSSLHTNSGQLAYGGQNATFTLRSDAAFSVNIAGQLVAPGETIELELTLDDEAKIVQPIFPAETGDTGKATFLLNIQQLKSIDTPLDLVVESCGLISSNQNGANCSTVDATVSFNGKLIHTSGRGISMTVFDPLLQVVSHQSYDTHASTVASNALADAITAVPNGNYIVLNTWDAPCLAFTPELLSAIKSLGATSASLDSCVTCSGENDTTQTYRSAYILVTQKGTGEILAEEYTPQYTSKISVTVPLVRDSELSDNGMIVFNEAGQRLYGDGTSADSCESYINPDSGRYYIGEIGSGTYLLSNGEAVECDMETTGGGWEVLYDLDIARSDTAPAGFDNRVIAEQQAYWLSAAGAPRRISRFDLPLSGFSEMMVQLTGVHNHSNDGFNNTHGGLNASERDGLEEQYMDGASITTTKNGVMSHVLSLPAAYSTTTTTDPSMGGAITRSWLTTDFQALPNNQLLTVTRSGIDADSLNLRFMEDQVTVDEDLGLKALRVLAK